MTSLIIEISVVLREYPHPQEKKQQPNMTYLKN